MYDFQRIKNFAPLTQQIVEAYYTSFSASEGETEGAQIRALVQNLLGNTAKGDIFLYAALHDDTVIGCAIFSRLTYSGDARNVFILSPMALLRESIAALKDHGIDVLMTYGDPNYYEKVGFLPVTEQVAPPPLLLSMPIGWIGQSLDGPEITPLQGTCTCVLALNDPAIW